VYRLCQGAHRHPEFADRTIWEVFEAERPKLVPYAGRFDGFHAVPAAVSKTCLVRFDNNKYSVAASAVGRPVEVHAYADRIVIRQDGRVVAEHCRSFGRGVTVYDPCMKAAFDEIMATAVKRQHEPQRILDDLLKAEISEKQARSIKYQLTIAKLPLAKDLNDFEFKGTPINETLVNDLAGGAVLGGRRLTIQVKNEMAF
jgi:hypothetical protein